MASNRVHQACSNIPYYSNIIQANTNNMTIQINAYKKGVVTDKGDEHSFGALGMILNISNPTWTYLSGTT